MGRNLIYVGTGTQKVENILNTKLIPKKILFSKYKIPENFDGALSYGHVQTIYDNYCYCDNGNLCCGFIINGDSFCREAYGESYECNGFIGNRCCEENESKSGWTSYPDKSLNE